MTFCCYCYYIEINEVFHDSDIYPELIISTQPRANTGESLKQANHTAKTVTFVDRNIYLVRPRYECTLEPFYHLIQMLKLAQKCSPLQFLALLLNFRAILIALLPSILQYKYYMILNNPFWDVLVFFNLSILFSLLLLVE